MLAKWTTTVGQMANNCWTNGQQLLDEWTTIISKWTTTVRQMANCSLTFLVDHFKPYF